MSLILKLWGVRGSLPTPLPPQIIEKKIEDALIAYRNTSGSSHLDIKDFLAKLPVWQRGGYGGHTACFEIQSPKQRLIIDCGSGLMRLGERLMIEGFGLGRGEAHILITHFHWDHLLGLPFFSPIFIKGNKIHFYAVQDDLEENIRAVFQKPRFPVAFDNLASQIYFHKLEPRKAKQFHDITVTPYKLDHPDPCWGFRVESAGRVYAHCVDTECSRMSEEQLGADLALYQNVNVMLFDAQYSFAEINERVNWGHASAPLGLDLAIRERVERVYFMHHDPAATDHKIHLMEEQTREYFDAQQRNKPSLAEDIHPKEWGFAHEGMVIQI